jgi:hypothetical protein
MRIEDCKEPAKQRNVGFAELVGFVEVHQPASGGELALGRAEATAKLTQPLETEAGGWVRNPMDYTNKLGKQLPMQLFIK